MKYVFVKWSTYEITQGWSRWGGYSAWTEEWPRDQVSWCNYVKPVQILKRCENEFSRWDEILDRRPSGQVLQDHVSKRIFSKMGMTLRSLETYWYIGSKTKSYRNIKKISSTIYLPTLQTLACKPQCLQIFHPRQKHNLPKPRIIKSVPTIWTIPRLLSPLLATWCPSPQAAPEQPTSLAIALWQPEQFIHQGAVLVVSNKPYSYHPHGGSIGLELCVDQEHVLTTLQATDLAGEWIDKCVISSHL